MTDSRERILTRLRSQPQPVGDLPPLYRPEHDWYLEFRIDRFISMMRAVRTEVIRLADRDWQGWLNRELVSRNLKRVMLGENDSGRTYRDSAVGELQVSLYDQGVETAKPTLFQDVDVGVTTTLGAIAETGSLILWPDAAEPRLLSLAPPVHVALVESNKIYNTFADAMAGQQWADGMPTNALLISGPSKTADIEQTLAYGIHGPRQLIVLLLG
jgi:L-lactate dehydrogenase complex protein LldG